MRKPVLIEFTSAPCSVCVDARPLPDGGKIVFAVAYFLRERPNGGTRFIMIVIPLNRPSAAGKILSKLQEPERRGIRLKNAMIIQTIKEPKGCKS